MSHRNYLVSGAQESITAIENTKFRNKICNGTLDAIKLENLDVYYALCDLETLLHNNLDKNTYYDASAILDRIMFAVLDDVRFTKRVNLIDLIKLLKHDYLQIR